MDLRADVDALARLLPGEAPDASRLSTVPDVGRLPAATSAFDVVRLLSASAAHAIAAADAVGAQRGISSSGRVLDPHHVLAYCTTHTVVDGEPVPVWADLSGIYDTADGRAIQLHCNFPHHAEGVVSHLGCGSDRASVAAAISQRDSLELEAELIDAGMVGAVIRTLDEWNRHPHAAATGDLPVMSARRIGDAPPLSARSEVGSKSVDELLGDVRVVDSSRVLAGPTAGSMLAGFGADVLRVGADHLPSVPVGVMATGYGKRNASIDVTTTDGLKQFEHLLADAEVWIDAFRPGAFGRRGLTPEHVAALRPGIVIVQISAFDWIGPWAGRRGYDSIVQSTTGVRWAGGEFGDGVDGPAGLPVQALDYATGFLAAGAAAQMVAHQRTAGGSWLVRLSLLRTRNWLVSMGDPIRYEPVPVAVDPALLHTVDSDFGRLMTVRPFVGRLGHAPRRLGADPAEWLSP